MRILCRIIGGSHTIKSYSKLSLFGGLTVLYFTYQFRLHAPRKEQIITMVIAVVIYAGLNFNYWLDDGND